MDEEERQIRYPMGMDRERYQSVVNYVQKQVKKSIERSQNPKRLNDILEETETTGQENQS